MIDYWLYTENDDAGCVVSGKNPRDALRNAIKMGWDPGDAEVWAYPLPHKPVYLGVVEEPSALEQLAETAE